MAADSFIVCIFWVATKLDRFLLYQHGDNSDFVNIFDMTFFNSDDFSNSSVLWFESSLIDFELQGDDSINYVPDRQEFFFRFQLALVTLDGRWRHYRTFTIVLLKNRIFG